jgi:hypothetical protein
MYTERGTLSADSSGNTHQLVKLEAFPSIIHRISAAFDKNKNKKDNNRQTLSAAFVAT